MKSKKHLFNGRIELIDGLYIANDTKGNVITYASTLDACKVQVHSYLQTQFTGTPFVTEYYQKTGAVNFSAFKRGRN